MLVVGTSPQGGTWHEEPHPLSPLPHDGRPGGDGRPGVSSARAGAGSPTPGDKPSVPPRPPAGDDAGDDTPIPGQAAAPDVEFPVHATVRHAARDAISGRDAFLRDSAGVQYDLPAALPPRRQSGSP